MERSLPKSTPDPFWLLASLLLAGALFWGLPVQELAAQSLEPIRTDVRTSDSRPTDDSEEEKPTPRPPRNSSSDPCNQDPWCDEDDANDDFSSSIAGLVLFALATPYWAPAVALGDDYISTRGYFAHYPHQYDLGYMMIDPFEAHGLAGPRVPYAWSVRASGEYGTNFNHLEWLGGRVLIDSRWRLGLDSDVRYLLEERPGRPNDDVWFGDTNLVYRFAQSERLVLRSGLGMNFLSDDRQNDTGFNFTYGGDWFPSRPWVLSAEIDLGTLGHTHAYHFRGTAGVTCGVGEAYVGYDYYDIGRTQVAGLVAGLRLWY